MQRDTAVKGEDKERDALLKSSYKKATGEMAEHTGISTKFWKVVTGQ